MADKKPTSTKKPVATKEEKKDKKQQAAVVTKDKANEVAEQLIEELLREEVYEPANRVEQEWKEIKEALTTLGTIDLTRIDPNLLEEAKELKSLDVTKINYVVNPNNFIITLGNGVSVKPYSIVYLPKLFPHKDKLDALRRSPKFVNALRSRLLWGFEDIPVDKLRKMFETFRLKAKNVLEAAEKRGITGEANLENLIKTDKKVKDFYKKMMEKWRKYTGTDKLTSSPTGRKNVI